MSRELRDDHDAEATVGRLSRNGSDDVVGRLGAPTSMPHADEPRLPVLYLLNSSQIGGGNRSMLTLWSFIRSKNVGIRATAPGGGPMIEACAKADVSVSIVPNVEPSWRHPFEVVQEIWRWTATIAAGRPALIHSNGFVPSRCVALAASANRIPHICHVRFGERSPYLNWAFRGLPKPDVFIFSSRALSDEVRPDLERACPRATFEIVHNAVDLDSFRPAPRTPGAPRIGIVANLLPVKGHLDFLQMAKTLLQQGLKAEFWVIGGDIHATGYDAELRQAAADLGVSHAITFFEHRADVPSLMAQLDVLVCASHKEPFGRALIEAMACSIPVVATRTGGIPEVVVDGVTGILVPPHAPGELAAAVASLLESPTRSAELGAAGRARAEREFGGEAHARRIRSIYDRLCG